METAYIKIGKRGVVVIPNNFRQHYGLIEGDLVMVEDSQEGILLKPTITLPIEKYTVERKAEFLLSNAMSKKEYEAAKKTTRDWGLDPEKIPHFKFVEPKPAKD